MSGNQTFEMVVLSLGEVRVDYRNIFIHFRFRNHFIASLHISASHVTSGAELRARFSRASMMALILLMVEDEGEFAA